MNAEASLCKKLVTVVTAGGGASSNYFIWRLYIYNNDSQKIQIQNCCWLIISQQTNSLIDKLF